MSGSDLLRLANLDGYRIAYGYFLELEHHLMGMFPAVLRNNPDEIIFCLSKSLILRVASRLVPRKFKVTKIMVLVNEKDKIAFDIRTLLDNLSRNEESEFFRVFDGYDVSHLNSTQIKWAPGLISSEYMTRTEFIEIIRLAMEKI